MAVALQTAIWVALAGGAGVLLGIAIDKKSFFIGVIALITFALATDLMPNIF